jgi:hypothetical protein
MSPDLKQFCRDIKKEDFQICYKSCKNAPKKLPAKTLTDNNKSEKISHVY